MKKALKWLDEHFEETILVVLLVIIACISFIQVIVRKLPFIPTLKWAEEFCRFMWIWSVFLSLPYTIKKGNMLRVSIMLDLFPEPVKKIINIFVDVVVAAVMAFLCYHSVGVIKGIQEANELSPAMAWPMWIVYIVVFIGFFLGAIRGIEMAIYHITHFKEKELSTKEQAERDAAEEAAAAAAAEGGD